MKEELSMNRKRTASAFLTGVLAAVMVIFLVVPAVAASMGKQIQVYTGIKVYIDDVLIQPKDANGKDVDVFVYNGTTYLPIRAIGTALGMPVSYDGATNSAYIGKHGTDYLLKVCPPYQYFWTEAPTTVKMAGQTYANCLTVYANDTSWSGGQGALFNLNGQYNSLRFIIGHQDGKEMREATYYIYLDGNLAFSVDLTGDMLPKQYTVPLHGALQMKIVASINGGRYAMAEVEIS